MATLEDEFSEKFGRPVRKEDVRLGQRWPGTWDETRGFRPVFHGEMVGKCGKMVGKCGNMWENVGNSSSFGWNFYEIVGKEVIFAMENCDNII